MTFDGAKSCGDILAQNLSQLLRICISAWYICVHNVYNRMYDFTHPINSLQGGRFVLKFVATVYTRVVLHVNKYVHVIYYAYFDIIY